MKDKDLKEREVILPEIEKEEEKVEKVEVTKKPTKKIEPRLSLAQYFSSARSDVHLYQRASLQRMYMGIIKTEADWNKELANELGEKE